MNCQSPYVFGSQSPLLTQFNRLQSWKHINGAGSGLPGKNVLRLLTGLTSLVFIFGLLVTPGVQAQNDSRNTDNITTSPSSKQSKVVIVTGARFCYPLIQKWIDDYYKSNPETQIIIESRGSADPAQYDVLVEVYEPSDELKKTREYVYLARYAILPVANSKSAFASLYGNKGLTQDLIKQLFFHDLYAEKQKEQAINVPYTIYTRLQRAGVPIAFTHYFGFDQKDIKGKAIAGADEHLLKAILRDTTAVSYLPLTLIYDRASGKPLPGLAVLPVDLNGNGKISNDEKFYDHLTHVLDQLESIDQADIHNIPVPYIHLSVNKQTASQEAISFVRWAISNGQKDLHDFGYLNPERDRLDNNQFEHFASKRN